MKQHRNEDNSSITTLLERLQIKTEEEIQEIFNRYHEEQLKIKNTQSQQQKHEITAKRGRELQVGDIVQVLNNGKTGKRGDLARVDRIGKQRVSITVLATGTPTNRILANLKKIR